jgi:hypothetical protein
MLGIFLVWMFKYFMFLFKPGARSSCWWLKTNVPTLDYISCKISICSGSCSYRWCETMSLNCSHQQACCSSPRWYLSIESHGGMILTGENWRTQRETCPSATLSTTNPIWSDLGVNPGLCIEMPASNCLSHGMALISFSRDGRKLMFV